MKSSRRKKMQYEPPAVLLTDLAFNLVIFFVVCASTDPESGRKQEIPRGTKDPTAATQMAKNVEVIVTRTEVQVNGVITPLEKVGEKLEPLLTGKTRPEERMVVLKTSPTKDTPYHRWIRVTALIEKAGGIVALQMEESRDVVVP